MAENVKGSMVDPKDIIDEKELSTQGKRVAGRIEENTELVLFALLRKIIAALERIATALEGGKKDTDVSPSKPVTPTRKPPTGSAEAVVKTMALFPKGLLDGFDVTVEKYEVRIMANKFVGGELYEEIKAIVLEKGGSWMPKKEDRKGYFSISKRNI